MGAECLIPEDVSDSFPTFSLLRKRLGSSLPGDKPQRGKVPLPMTCMGAELPFLWEGAGHLGGGWAICSGVVSIPVTAGRAEPLAEMVLPSGRGSWIG